jgi:ATP-binding cassette subfamily B protein
MSRVTSDSDRVAELVTWGLLDVTWALMNIITASFFMLLINWRLALIVMLCIPIMVVVAILFRKKILLSFKQQIQLQDHWRIQRNITGSSCRSLGMGKCKHA